MYAHYGASRSTHAGLHASYAVRIQRCMRTFTRAYRHVCAQHTAHRVLHARVVCAYRYSSFRSAPTLTITPRRSSGKMATGVYLHFMNAICPPKLSCRLVCFFPPCPLLGGTPTAKRPAMKRRWMQAVLYEILKTLREPAGLQQHACLRGKYTPSRDRVCAANGFVCIVNGVRRRIYARGIWFPLDTPMRNKFWGVSRGQACTRCIKRVGTSAFTAGPPKSGGHIRQLLADVRSHERRAAAGEPGADRAAQSARERMRRHGHHPESHVLTRLLGSQYGNLLLLHSQLGVQGLDNQGDYLHRDLLNFCGVYFCGATNAVMASVHGCRDEFNRRMRAVPKQHSRHGGCASRKCPIITATKPMKKGKKAPKGGAKSAQAIKEVHLYVQGLRLHLNKRMYGCMRPLGTHIGLYARVGCACRAARGIVGRMQDDTRVGAGGL